MALVLTNVGERIMLEYLANKDGPEDLVLRLFTNNYTPVAASVAGSFTEATGNGYAAKALAAANGTVTPGAPSELAYPLQTFSFSATGGTYYGYFVTRQTSGECIWAERFAGAPYTINNLNDKIEITPRFTLASVQSD